MPTLEIKKYPNQILRKKCQEVKEVTKEIKALIRDMLQTMQENQGVGLAAPQVGVLKRIITIGTEKDPIILINPKILKKSEEEILDREGCLSIPGIYLRIKRPKKIEVEALNKEFKKIQMRAEGLLARIIQHEIDHLNGILIIDRIPFWQRWKIRNKLKEIKNGLN